jgi:hypothetical protein
MKSTAVVVATTPTEIVTADNKFRTVYIHNGGGAKIYIGDESVTTTTGFHLGNGESIDIALPLGENLMAVVASSTNTVNVLTPDGD